MRPANQTTGVPTPQQHSQNMSNMVVPSPAQQQMPPHQAMQMYHTAGGAVGGGATPFSPHNMYNQQMLTPIQQPHSQQTMAPGTPATPQQPQSMGSMHHIQQPGSVLQQQPGSVGIPTPIAQPPSAGGYAGAHIMAPMSSGGSSAAPTAAAAPAPNMNAQVRGELDPIANAKALMLKDLRRSITNLNMYAEKALDHYMNSAQSTGAQQEEKRPVALVGGPPSNLGSGGGGGPPSNLGLMNPHSVPNPMSANPMSVTMQAPGSVKSADEQMAAMGGVAAAEDLSVAEQYETARNHFMNVCDSIERSLQLVLEVNRQQGKLISPNPQMSSAIAWGNNIATNSLPQMIRGYTDLMNADKQAIRGNIDSLNFLISKLGGSGQTGQQQLQNQKVEPMEE